jgi:hypothetical protein
MTPSEVGRIVFSLLSRSYSKTGENYHGLTEVSCDEDYRTIHVQTDSEHTVTIKLS